MKASRAEQPNLPGNTLDRDPDTYWAAEGDGEWISYDAGKMAMIGEVAVAWPQGDRQTAFFTLEVSNDGRKWKQVFSGSSSGTTRDLETYTFPAVAAR